MPYLLNIVYLLVLLLAAPWLLYQAWRKGKYRAGFAEKFCGRVPVRTGDKPCIWLHAVSVGEVNLLAPLLKEFARRRPDCECVISTTSVAGFQLAKNKYPQHVVFYCPLDFSWAVRAAMRRVRPTMLVLAELELWPNLICAANESGAKVAVVNGRLSDKSFRGYLRIRPLLSGTLQRIDCIAAQTAEFAQRFVALGARPEAVQSCGSLKYDGAQTDRNNPVTRRLSKLANIVPSDKVFLAGSTQAPEEQLALDTFRELVMQHSSLRLIIVPRHPERFEEVAKLIVQSGFTWRRRSALNDDEPTTWQVLFVDTIGELGAWWGTADIAFVGGSLGNRGGQNMIEPAAYGAAVCFGPNTWNFRDIVASLLAVDAARVMDDRTELTAFVKRCLDDPQFAQELGTRSRELVAANLGAAERTVGLLLRYLPARTSTAHRSAA